MSAVKKIERDAIRFIGIPNQSITTRGSMNLQDAASHVL
jgi:hypothetical protein